MDLVNVKANVFANCQICKAIVANLTIKLDYLTKVVYQHFNNYILNPQTKPSSYNTGKN